MMTRWTLAMTLCLGGSAALGAACGDDGGEADTVAADTTGGDTNADTTDADDTADDTIGGDTGAIDVATDVDAGCTEDCQRVEWLQVGDLEEAVDHHATFVRTSAAGTYLYVVGGVTQRASGTTAGDAVRRAKILDDHLLGDWEDEAPLPAPLGFHGFAEDADAVWLTSGVSQDAQGVFATNRTYVGRFDADGHVSFVAATALPQEARVHPTAHRVGELLVVVGGSGGQMNPLDGVRVATVGGGGALGAWSEGPALPAPRSHHAGVVREGRVWLFGGFTTDQEPLSPILRSVHDGTGAMTGWEAVGSLPEAPWTHAATLHAGGVLLVGGGDGGPGAERYIGRVRFARFDDAGGLGAFADVADPLPRVRAHVHQTPIHDGFVYSAGGRGWPSQQSISDVFVGYLTF